MSYTPLLRRIREKKTNYRKRKALLVGRHNFATVLVSNQNVQVQILQPGKQGDRVLISSHSRELMKHGWKGSRKSIPACYLTGLLAGRKALAKNVKECILYAGNRIFSPRIASCLKGLSDAGINIPVEEETLPKEDILTGKHIADYARDLKEKSSALYKSKFSALITAGFVPENYVDNVERTKSSILGKQVFREERKEVPVEEAPRGVKTKEKSKAVKKTTQKRAKEKKPVKRTTKKATKSKREGANQ